MNMRILCAHIEMSRHCKKETTADALPLHSDARVTAQSKLQRLAQQAADWAAQSRAFTACCKCVSYVGSITCQPPSAELDSQG